MSFLTPLYIAGLLAVSLPVVFHLIRRTPQGETPFSSLMFLAPSPPRITRRSRIEHWLLLVLRGLALVLLALAFSRPFWRETALGSDEDAPQRRVAVVVDASASMRRGDLWQQAVRQVEQVVAECRPQDEVAVFACDEVLKPIAGFDDLARVESGTRASLIASRLNSIGPTWAGTHLGQGLVDAIAMLDQPRDATEERGRAARRIVLVSDMQAGGRLAVLGDFPWPANLQLELKPVAVAGSTNAGLERLADESAEDAEAAGRPAALRIRVTSAADSAAEEFRLQWTDAAGVAAGQALDAYVPPGESRVVRVPPPPESIDQPRLMLSGDAQDFDNALFVVPPKRQTATVVYFGSDEASDPEGLRYYLERALTSNPGRDVNVQTVKPDAELKFDKTSPPELVVATAEPSPAQAATLREYAMTGGTVIYVLLKPGDGAALAALSGLAIGAIEDAKVDGYAMLGEIDFSHPLFASMAGPKFNDFTQIRFWKYRRIQLPPSWDVHVVARFESGDPAIIERRLDKGRLVVLTAGWQPSDGQLARSWRFLLMLSSLLDDPGRCAEFRRQLSGQPARRLARVESPGRECSRD